MNKMTNEQKQAFWAEQLPNFESKYWLPDHFDFLVFDIEQGNYVIKSDLDPSFEDDATEIFHRVNTGWAMWKKAIKFAEQQATPEGFVLLPIEPSEAIKTALSYQCFDFIKVAQVYRNLGFDIPKKAEDEQSFFLHKFLILAIKNGNDFIKVFNAETKAMIEAQEQSHENS